MVYNQQGRTLAYGRLPEILNLVREETVGVRPDGVNINVKGGRRLGGCALDDAIETLDKGEGSAGLSRLSPDRLDSDNRMLDERPREAKRCQEIAKR